MCFAYFHCWIGFAPHLLSQQIGFFLLSCFLWDYLALMLLLASPFSSPSLLVRSNYSVSSMPLEHSPSPPQPSEATSDSFLFVTSLLPSYYKLVSLGLPSSHVAAGVLLLLPVHSVSSYQLPTGLLISTKSNTQLISPHICPSICSNNSLYLYLYRTIVVF